MKFHAIHVNWTISGEADSYFLLGFAGGRVGYEPQARHLYSLRVFLLLFKVEILWMTGVDPNFNAEDYCR